MKVIIWGATGMVGQGVVRECLLDADVTSILAIVRTPTNIKNEKFHEIIHSNMWDYSSIEKDLSGFDAAFFCLGTPSAGKSEAEYTRITYDLTLAAANTLSRNNPQMTFIYVSGQGADSTEKGLAMWGRVRGKTENALLKLPFKAVHIFRPGIIIPEGGIQSKTTLYRIFYNILGPVLGLMRSIIPNFITTTEIIGKAMLGLAKRGYDKPILTSPDFEKLSKSL